MKIGDVIKWKRADLLTVGVLVGKPDIAWKYPDYPYWNILVGDTILCTVDWHLEKIR